jgi:tRNA(Leu) C34 or U34 (ribose-2'-O)-methylase TrmL
MRGYFGIGAERISKPMNLGSLLRTAHAFGASFAFTIGASFEPRAVARADTSVAADNLPLHVFADLDSLALPVGCRLVGVELIDEAAELPSFRHPARAAYVFGPERGSLSPALVARCDFLVKIPTKFCVNLGVAGALVMYDRMLSMGRFAERPVRVGGPTQAPARHVQGGPVLRGERRRAAREREATAQATGQATGQTKGEGARTGNSKTLASGEPVP